MDGAELIAKERRRQVSAEDWSPEHDDEHTSEELARAGAFYAWPTERGIGDVYGDQSLWPDEWHIKWDKKHKHSRIRQLVIAGALIAAEIDRLQRQESAPAESDER